MIVHSDNQLEIRCPLRYPRWKAERFLQEKAGWIQQKQFVNLGNMELPDLKSVDDDDLRHLRTEFMNRLQIVLADYSGPHPEKWSIRRQKTRWGSCSSKRQISINLLALFLPDSLFRYLVFHELAHLKHMNHSPAYWNYLESLFPEARNCRKALRRYRLPG